MSFSSPATLCHWCWQCHFCFGMLTQVHCFTMVQKERYKSFKWTFLKQIIVMTFDIVFCKLWLIMWGQIIFKREEESLVSSLLNKICRQNWYQSKSDYMNGASVSKLHWYIVITLLSRCRPYIDIVRTLSSAGCNNNPPIST